MKRFSLVTFLLMLISTSALAHYDGALTEIHFQISIKNDTPYDCKLIDANTISGTDQSVYNPTLKSGDNATFVILQIFKHAEHFVSFRCNNKTISFLNQRNATIFVAGKVRGNILPNQTDPGIFAEITDRSRGSAFLGLPGHIAWAIHSPS